VIAKPSAQFVAKMQDVLAVYQHPYDPKHPVVLSVDEVSKTLHDTPHWQFKPAHARIKLKQLYPVTIVKYSS